MDNRSLSDLKSIGKAALADFRSLGIDTVAQLAAADPVELYERLGVLSGAPHDICVLDTLRAAVAQARDPDLPAEQRKWWYWSRLRKSGVRLLNERDSLREKIEEGEQHIASGHFTEYSPAKEAMEAVSEKVKPRRSALKKSAVRPQ